MPKSYYIRVCALFSAILLICNIVATDTSFAGFVAIEKYNPTWLGSCGSQYRYSKNECIAMGKKQSNDVCGGKSSACVCDGDVYKYDSSNCSGTLLGGPCDNKYKQCIQKPEPEPEVKPEVAPKPESEKCVQNSCEGYTLSYCPDGANCEECTKGCGDTTTKYKVTGCQVETTTCGSEYNLYSCPSGWECDECKSYSCGDYGPVLSVRYRKTCMKAPDNYCIRPYMDKCPDNGYCNEVTFCGGITKYELRFDATGGCKYGVPIKHNCGYECPGEPAVDSSGNSTSTSTSTSGGTSTGGGTNTGGGGSYCGYGSESACVAACQEASASVGSSGQKCSTPGGAFCGKSLMWAQGCTSVNGNDHMCDCSVSHISSTGVCNGIICNQALPGGQSCSTICQYNN